jgi:hypothetical protein
MRAKEKQSHENRIKINYKTTINILNLNNCFYGKTQEINS